MNKETKEPVIIKNGFGEQFAGSKTCVTCHENIYNDNIHTAHYLTSQPAFEKYIKGSFEPGKNTFAYNRSVAIAMERRDSGFYQVEYYKDIEKKARRFDIVIGSGTMGQSYLYWRNNQLFQLPITFFSAANAWSNSPGFPDKIIFNRPITSRCLECHTTFVKTISDAGKEPEEYDHRKIIYGVDCEKCHGPAARHVEFHLQNSNGSAGKYIINPKTFTRQQSLDLCASCHGGRLQKIKPSFEFTAGDTLSKFFSLNTSAPDPHDIDVHGNQYGLLRVSKCFKISAMTCVTCHNTHKNERGKIDVFSQRCISCHNVEHKSICKLTKSLGSIINTNCIDCHMPLKASKVIAVQLHGDSLPTAALIRSHFITVYKEETKEVIKQLKRITPKLY